MVNKSQINVIALLIGVLFLNQSCRTKLINVQIVSNPKIALAPEVKKIALVNLVKTNNIGNKLGEVLAGEIPGNDSRLAAESLNSLEITIASSKKYAVSQSAIKIPQKNNNLSFGEPISWTKIDSFAKSENADVVIALEYFNASFAVNINQTLLNGNNNPTYGIAPNLLPGLGRVYGESRAETGFRIYDNLHKTIVFQNNALNNPNFNGENIVVYPNPVTNNQFNIALPSNFTGEVRVKMINTIGQTVYQTKIEAQKTITISPNSTLAQGLYFVELTNQGKSSTKKIIIQ